MLCPRSVNPPALGLWETAVLGRICGKMGPWSAGCTNALFKAGPDTQQYQFQHEAAVIIHGEGISSKEDGPFTRDKDGRMSRRSDGRMGSAMLR